ncbi:MAG: amidohydrolase family protein, partial [Beijerinckiaceae bacterium]
RVLPAIDVIRSATTIGAKLVMQEGKLGCLKPGAHADIILVDGDPLKNLALLTGQGKHIPLIMKAGRLYKNKLR